MNYLTWGDMHFALLFAKIIFSHTVGGALFLFLLRYIVLYICLGIFSYIILDIRLLTGSMLMV